MARDRRAVGALLVGGLLAGCVSVSSGPLGVGLSQSGGEECAPVRPGGVLSYGFEAFRNPGSAPATINRVGLADDHGLRILQAWIVPIAGTYIYGVVDGYPPYPHLPPGIQWAQRQKAEGAVVPPLRGRQVVNLVLVLKPLRKVATATGVDVYYTESGTQYHVRTHFALRVVTAKSC